MTSWLESTKVFKPLYVDTDGLDEAHAPGIPFDDLGRYTQALAEIIRRDTRDEMSGHTWTRLIKLRLALHKVLHESGDWTQIRLDGMASDTKIAISDVAAMLAESGIPPQHVSVYRDPPEAEAGVLPDTSVLERGGRMLEVGNGERMDEAGEEMLSHGTTQTREMEEVVGQGLYDDSASSAG